MLDFDEFRKVFAPIQNPADRGFDGELFQFPHDRIFVQNQPLDRVVSYWSKPHAAFISTGYNTEADGWFVTTGSWRHFFDDDRFTAGRRLVTIWEEDAPDDCDCESCWEPDDDY